MLFCLKIYIKTIIHIQLFYISRRNHGDEEFLLFIQNILFIDDPVCYCLAIVSSL